MHFIVLDISCPGFRPRGLRMTTIAREFCSVGTGPDGAVAMSSANALVGTGFASRYRLQRVFKGSMGKATTPSSLSLTCRLLLNTNLLS